MLIEHIPSIDSTNSELMRRAAQGDYSTVCLVTHEQTAGRGRLGRAWLSDQDSLTFSMGIPLKPYDWSGLSLAVGVSIAQSLHPNIQIKWPNDLWVGGKKLAGILIETIAIKDTRRDDQSDSRYAVIGVGINLKAPSVSAIQELRTPPTGLRFLLPHITREETLKRIQGPLMDAIKGFEAEGYASFAVQFAKRDALVGKSINLSNGLSGQYLGINGSGALMLQTENGVQTIVSQEVSECL